MAESSFESLVRDTSRLMASAIRRVCGRRHRELVPDVQQEVYLALWKRLEAGGEIQHPSSYVYKVALTTALAVVKKRGLDTPSESDERRLAETPDRRPPADGLSDAERRRLLEQVMSRLDEERRRALSAYLAGLNHREVAELFGWSESVARHRIYRGIDELKRLVAASGDDRGPPPERS